MTDLVGLIPDDGLVMPAHNECFRGLHARITHLLEHQGAALDKLRELLVEPRRVIDTFRRCFAVSCASPTERNSAWRRVRRPHA